MPVQDDDRLLNDAIVPNDYRAQVREDGTFRMKNAA